MGGGTRQPDVRSRLMPSGGITSADNDTHISAHIKRSASPPAAAAVAASASPSALADGRAAIDDELAVDVSASPLQVGVVASDEYAGGSEGDDDDEEKSSGRFLSAPVAPSSPLSGQGGETAPRRRKSSHAGFSEQDDAHREEFLRVTRMEGYVFSWPREILYWLACPCTAFVLWLMHLWFPERIIPWRYRRVPLSEAQYVHVFGRVHGCELIPVQQLGREVVEAEAAEAEQSSPDSAPESGPSPLFFSQGAGTRRGSIGLLHPGEEGRMIVWRHMRFIYSPAANTFILQQADAAPSASRTESELRHTNVAALKAKELTERARIGLNHDQVVDNRVLYGENALLLPVPSVASLLFNEIFHPFYVFQMYSVVLWIFEEYWYFAGAIGVIAVVSIVQTLIETRRRMRELAELALFDCPVQVLRNSQVRTISSSKLVPGDVVQVGIGLMPCDLALIDGGAVVNESMLTGESVPVVKVNVQWPVNRLSDTAVPLVADSRHTLFSATRVLQLKPNAPDAPVLAVVVRTGFATTKGSLILSILYPQPSSFGFVTQSYKFIASLFTLSLIGFAVSVWQLKVVQDASAKTIVLRALDLITIVVPPSLPLALTVGINFALVWLKAEKIFCIAPSRINMAGKVRLMCFDKTGTLTAESLVFMGVFPSAVPGSDMPKAIFGQFQSPDAVGRLHMEGEEEEAMEAAEAEAEELEAQLERTYSNSVAQAGDRIAPDISNPISLSPELCVSMACCQSLAVMDGALIGDPLEQQTFEAAGASLQDTGELRGFQQLIRVQLATHEEEVCMGIREQFEFSSALQRMSVLAVDTRSGETWAFVKGSPEIMETLCTERSIPRDYKAVLAHFAHAGYRIIAIGRKRMDAVPQLDKAELRQAVECELEFLGLILLENKLKEETEPTLAVLRAAGIRNCMISGDNALTCVTVARDCKLVEPGVRIFQSVVSDDGHSVEWHDTEDDSLRLDPLTLRLPANVARTWVGPPPRYELALTGAAFKVLAAGDPAYFRRVVLNGQVFARMSPDQKAALITEFQNMDIYTGMCGDGANDCGALKTAHVGVSLSESEASIAAPFTYARPNISCIPILLAEGRSALITSFQLFRYMSMYSMIQFGAVILTYFQGSVLGNWQYLYQDLWIVFPLTIAMGATRANRHLSVKRPSGNLLSPRNVINLVIHFAICIGFQVGVYQIILHEHDYQHRPNKDNGPRDYITTSLYYFSNFQYLVVAALFSLGRPWKASILTNWKFCVVWLLGLAASAALLLSPLLEPAFFRSDDLPLPWPWRRTIGAMALLFAAASTLWELVLAPLLVAALRRASNVGRHTATVFGRTKAIEGPKAKPYHKLRGEFEAAWGSTHMY